MIATEPHRRAFGAQLEALGVDLAAVGEQAVVWLDAAEALTTFMPGGRVDAAAFHREVGSAVTKAAATGRPVCVYGEMVQLLWDAGKVVATLELESLWNEVVAEHRCSLLCAYRTSAFSGAGHAEALRRVCELHSSVLHAPAGQVVPTADGQSLGVEVVAHFLPEPTAPRDARGFTTDTLRMGGHGPALIEDARIGVSELATNAVIHARSAFSVAIRCSDRGARISVRDGSPRRPVIREPGSESAGGHGLRLVAALATAWGAQAKTPGKTVWAQLEPRVRPVPTPAAATFPPRPSPANAPVPRSLTAAQRPRLEIGARHAL